MINVILSTPLLIEDGFFYSRIISIEEAKALLKQGDWTNFCGHSTVKILSLEPSVLRQECTCYDNALCIKPNSRLDFGKEYSLKEIEDIGVKIRWISRIQS